jgi:hypothetical protein
MILAMTDGDYSELSQAFFPGLMFFFIGTAVWLLLLSIGIFKLIKYIIYGYILRRQPSRFNKLIIFIVSAGLFVATWWAFPEVVGWPIYYLLDIR